MATLRFLLISLVTCSGCVSLKSQMQVNPMAQISGPSILVEVQTEAGEQINNSFSAVIKDEAYKYLAAKGFVPTQSRAEAHSAVIFVPGTKDRQVYVPAQTYAVPVYQPGQTTTYNFYNNKGGSVYGSSQSSGTTQWQTGFREGYTAEIQDQWIQVYGYAQDNGKIPEEIFRGQVWRTKSDREFLNSEFDLRSGIRMVLQKSLFARVQRAPASSSSRLPGCRPMIGFEIDKEKLGASKVAVVAKVRAKTAADEAGIEAGDEVTTIAGHTYSDFTSDQNRVLSSYRSGPVKVTVLRKGVIKEFNIKAKETCPE